MRFTRKIHHVFQIVFRAAFGMIPFLVEDPIQHVPNALSEEMSTSPAVVQIRVVLEESSGQQAVAHADVPGQLTEVFGGHPVGARMA